MLGRRGGALMAVEIGRLPPIALFHIAWIDTPPHQLVTDAERGKEAFRLRSQARDGIAVEVVVMVVRQNDAGQWRQFVDVDRRSMESCWAGPLHRRRPLREYRIGEPVSSAQFQKHGG